MYEGATKLYEIPMGTYFEGEQKDFCTIKMPGEYIISSGYTEDGVNDKMNFYGIKVEKAFSDELEGQKVADREVIITSAGGTKLQFNIIPTSYATMQDEKTYAGEYKELNHGGYSAIYYVDTSEYVTADLSMSYQINNDVLLRISYEGPVADQIDLDQLARNIYNLITVIV